MRRLSLAECVCLTALLATPLTAAGGDTVTVELTGFSPIVHTEAGGFLIPSPTGPAGQPWAGWQAERNSFDLNQLRLNVRVGTFVLIAQADRMPSLSRALLVVTPDGTVGESVVPIEYRDFGTTRLQSFDLAVGRRFAPSGTVAVMPWVGLSCLRTVLEDQLLITRYIPDDGAGSGVLPLTAATVERLDGSFLGVVAGGDVQWRLGRGLWVWGRGTVRWVGGRERGTTAAVEFVGSAADPPPDDAAQTVSRATRHTSRLILTAEASVGLQLSERLALAAGWLLNDYTHNGGPAWVTGPFLRAVATF
jgi:hypothetical protein